MLRPLKYVSLPHIFLSAASLGKRSFLYSHNIFNNSFYAVTEKKTKRTHEDYKPALSISTKKLDDKIKINISDNGNGIPAKVMDKIFQPFFTTKPTGQGTGLGLSLSYDIIKAHGGEIKVKTKEGEGSEFILQLPTNL